MSLEGGGGWRRRASMFAAPLALAFAPRGFLPALILCAILAATAISALVRTSWSLVGTAVPTEILPAVAVAQRLAVSRRGGRPVGADAPVNSPGAMAPSGAARPPLVLNSPPGPGVALYLAGLVAPATATAIGCASRRAACATAAGFAGFAWFMVASSIAGLLFVFLAGVVLSGSREIALLTLALTALFARIGELAALLSELLWPPVFVGLVMWLGVAAYRRSSTALAAGAGGVIGVGALFEPLLLVMAPVLAASLAQARSPAAASMARQRVAPPGIVLALAVVVPAAAVFALALAALSDVYDPLNIVRVLSARFSERAAFQEIGLATWIAGWVAPVPLVQDIAPLLFTEAALHPLGPWVPGTFLHSGATEVLPQARSVTPSAPGQFAWLLERYVFGDAPGYLVATPTVLWRGIWGGAGVLALIGLFHLRSLVAYHAAMRDLGVLVVAFAPLLAVFAANVLLTANVETSNLALTGLYAYAIAYVAGGR